MLPADPVRFRPHISLAERGLIYRVIQCPLMHDIVAAKELLQLMCCPTTKSLQTEERPSKRRCLFAVSA